MKITPLLTKCVEIPAVSKNRLYGNSKFTINIDTSSFDIRKDYGDLIFSLEILDMPACCGIDELGNITFHENYWDELTPKEVGKLKSYVDQSLTYLLHKNTNKRSKLRPKRLFIANLTPDADKGSAFLRESFIRTKLFSLVKSFINKNSGNLIEVWISNN
jgi:hypothetical protein